MKFEVLRLAGSLAIAGAVMLTTSAAMAAVGSDRAVPATTTTGRSVRSATAPTRLGDVTRAPRRPALRYCRRASTDPVTSSP